MMKDSKNVVSLSKILSEKAKESHIDNDEKCQLIDLIDDLILVWCKEDCCLFAQILQHNITSDPVSENEEGSKIQTLVLSKPPIWNVNEIHLNPSGTGVLLVGSEGVAVAELPQRWGNPSLFEGGQETLTCRIKYAGENFFTFNPHVRIIAADWHPGSLDHSIITVLSSDNYLRIYNVSNLDFPEQAIAVGQSSSLGKEKGKFGMRENAVAYGIAPPLLVSEGPNLDTVIEDSTSSVTENVSTVNLSEDEKQKCQDLLWPVFILYSNGDLYYILTSLKKSLKRRFLNGPLSMLPSSFDNYGVDFCSLLVLPSSPVVLVVGNTRGVLHHCVVMETNLDDSFSRDHQKTEDLSVSMNKLNLTEPSSIYLHVYETVVLNLSLTSEASTHAAPIVLIPDLSTPARYWVSYREGCFGVSLPLVERLLLDDEDSKLLSGDLECYVEHLVCTRPVASASVCSVLGICVSTSNTLFALLSSGNIITVSTPVALVPSIPPFRLESHQVETSPLRKVHYKSFEDHIRSVLQKTTSQPLLVGGSLSGISPEEYLNLMKQVTTNLRENYILPQIKAREEIKRRQKILISQKEHLEKGLQVIQEDKQSLTEKAHELAEKYEEANDRHSNIMKRLEVVVGNLVRRMPFLSVNERGMLKELQDMTDRSKAFQTQLGQIQSKLEFQNSQIEKEKRNEDLKKSESMLSDNQLNCLKTSLGKECDQLETLVKKVTNIKKEMGL